MDLDNWADASRIIIALFSVIGFIVSFYFSRKSLEELRLDRRKAQRPYLVFEGGGYLIHISFMQVENESSSRVYPYKGDREGYVQNYKIGRLINYGPGTAFEIEIKWKAEDVWQNGQRLLVSDLPHDEKVNYTISNSTFPTNHTNLAKNQETWLLHFPYFITKDLERKITRIDGKLIIECNDSLGNKSTTIQVFRVFPRYSKKELTITFAEVIKQPK